MTNAPKVWIRKRKTKAGKTTYHLRWYCPSERKLKSRQAGTDYRRAMCEAAKLAEELADGSYRSLRRTTWEAFVNNHIDRIEGERNAIEAKRTLEELSKVIHPRSPKDVTYGSLEAYVLHLRRNGNTAATINKKLRYVRAALNMAIKRKYAAVSEFAGDLFRKVERKPPRVLVVGQETALLDAAETLYGFRWRCLVYVALWTGGRRGELLSLPWDRVGFDSMRIHFANTKSHKDRYVPIDDKMIGVLRKLQAQTLVYGGPFIGMADNLSREWGRIRKRAGVNVSLHDLRRTCCTRLIRAGVPLPTVQKIMGHADIKTTLEYYNWVSDDDMREAIQRMSQAEEVGYRPPIDHRAKAGR